MPRKSYKDLIIEHIFEEAATDLLLLDSDDEDEAEDLIANVEWDVATVSHCAYGWIERVPKQMKWLLEVLPSYDDGRFKQALRVTREQFDFILQTLQPTGVFVSKNNDQTASWIQLAVALHRFGFNGTGASIRNIAAKLGVSDGSAMIRYTRRVIKGLLMLKDQYIYWPNQKQREELLSHTFEDLPHCVAWMDGTKIKLAEAPTMDKESYFDKNKDYSLQLMLVCDNNKRIIYHHVAGYPGSVHDSRIYYESDLGKNPARYLFGDQWISADKGYALSEFVITPYRENTRGIPIRQIRDFNKYFSRSRVKIEHVNGALKNTFTSLQDLRIKIRDNESHKKATEWIEACLILYNMILPLENYVPPDEADLGDDEDDVAIVNSDVSADTKRKMILYYILKQIA